MRVIQLSELKQSPNIYEELAEVLRNDGIVCIPAGSTYRLVANLLSKDAVVNSLQIKRRTKQAPVLVFVPDQTSAKQVVTKISPQAQKLIDAFWPGDLTLLFDINQDIPKKIRKNINSKGKIGVRIPDCEVINPLVKAFNGPLFVSSANISRKAGSFSEAQIRKNFGRWVDVLISAGDLPGNRHSTVLDVTTDPPTIKRPGTIPYEEILQVWQSALPLDSSNSAELQINN